MKIDEILRGLSSATKASVLREFGGFDASEASPEMMDYMSFVLSNAIGYKGPWTSAAELALREKKEEYPFDDTMTPDGLVKNGTSDHPVMIMDFHPKVSVIFLDIDGTLNGNFYRKAYFDKHGKGIPTGPLEIDPSRCRLLDSLIEDTGAHLVLSSAWRKMLAIDSMQQILHLRDCRKAHLIGATPHLFYEDVPEGSRNDDWWSRNCRGVEIARWLHMWRNIDSFVILDDSSDMGRLRRRLVRCDPNTGLSADDVEAAKRILKKPITSGEVADCSRAVLW